MATDVYMNFSAGQVDARAAARQDNAIYRNCLAKADNLMPLSQAGFATRPRIQKLVYLGYDPDLGGTVFKRLHRWRFDDDERYLFIFSSTYVRIYRITQNQWVSYIRDFDLRTYWTAATAQELKELNFASHGDRTLVCHRNLRPIIITRTSLYQFTLEPFSFGEWGSGDQTQEPTWKQAAAEICIQYGSVTGVAASSFSKDETKYVWWTGTDPNTGEAFNPDSIAVGSTIRIHNRPCEVLAVADANDRVQVKAHRDMPRTVEFTIVYSLDRTNYNRSNEWVDHETVVCEETGGEGIIGTRTVTDLGGGSYEYTVEIIVERGDFFKENAVIVGAESGVVAYIVLNGWTDVTNAPTPWWEESIFSAYHGYFSAAAFFEQRLWIGGSWDAPSLLCGSRIRDFRNFDLGEGVGTDAIQLLVASDETGLIKNLVSARHLLIFTDNGEHYVGEDETQTISPRTVSIRSAGNFGVGQAAPATFAGKVFLCDRSNRQIRVYGWDDVQQTYAAVPITYMHEDLFTGIAQFVPMYAFDGGPSENYFVLDGDGTIVLVNASTTGQQMGFWPWRADSFIYSIAGDVDRLFMINGPYLCRTDSTLPCELPARATSMQLTMEAQGIGSTRGHYVRLSKIEIEGVLRGVTVNGRLMRMADEDDSVTPARYEQWQLGWTRKPIIDLQFPAGLKQEVYAVIATLGI